MKKLSQKYWVAIVAIILVVVLSVALLAQNQNKETVTQVPNVPSGTELSE